jgi:hypothetical protein
MLRREESQELRHDRKDQLNREFAEQRPFDKPFARPLPMPCETQEMGYFDEETDTEYFFTGVYDWDESDGYAPQFMCTGIECIRDDKGNEWDSIEDLSDARLVARLEAEAENYL